MVALATWALAFGALTAVLLSIPYGLSALDYRLRDNGLAFILLVAGVAVWNGMVFNQLLTPDPAVRLFFLGLSVVGSVLAGLGFFLFASTASSTPDYLNRGSVYAIAGVLGGLDIVFAVTAPLHRVYWNLVAGETGTMQFAAIDPGLGYWAHTVLLIALFGAGAMLFLEATLDRSAASYRWGYVLAGTATVVAIAVSNGVAPGGFGVASITAASLTSVGWLQASRGEPMAWIRGLAA